MSSANQRFHTLIVEDEVLPRNELKKALEEGDEFEVIASCESNREAFNLLSGGNFDVIFLDISLSDGSSFHLLSQLTKNDITIPAIVVVTGHREFEYAQKLLNEYKDQIIYILNKPFWENWIAHHDHIIDKLSLRAQKSKWDKKQEFSIITIKSDKQTFFIDPKEIKFIKTGEKGSGKTCVALIDKEIESSSSLNQLLKQLPYYFFQINRFVAVNVNFVSSVDHSDREVYLKNNTCFPIGSEFYNDMREALDF